MNVKQEIKEIEERLEWMAENLERCDWCCGGGDREWEDLQKELEGLQHSLKVERLREVRLSLRD